MPTVSYQIRNEYGLGGSELYGAADKYDPEAILEGVAMAGLVGLLRQLGDLAEYFSSSFFSFIRCCWFHLMFLGIYLTAVRDLFYRFAAEVFGNLHEDVMSTASRGHELILRVKQLETEVPPIIKGFSPERLSRLSYKEGIHWHCNWQMSQNRISAEDMPHFIMDTYEECRGPPQLFKLDKFDVAGDGACLKRYSDPSFYRVQLTSTRLEEQNVPRDKRTHKIKVCNKKRTLKFSLLSRVNCLYIDCCPLTNQVFDRTLKHIKLKVRHLNESVIQSTRSYMEIHNDLDPIQQQVISETSASQSIVVKSADSSELGSQVVVDASPNMEKLPRESPTKQEMRTESDLDKQKLEKELPDTQFELASEIRKAHPYMLEANITGSKNAHQIGRHSYGSQSTEENSNHLSVQEMQQNAECRPEKSSDGYISDEVSSDMDSYMDALTTMESEIETDAENRSKSDSGLMVIESQETDSDTTEEQDELKYQFSEQYVLENSTSSPGFSTIFRKGTANPSFSDTLGHLAAQLLEENMNQPSIPSNSKVNLVRTNVKTSSIPTSSVCGEAFCSSTTGPTSTATLVMLCMNETHPSCERKTDQAGSYLADELPSKEKSNLVHGEFDPPSGGSLHRSMDQKLLEDDIPRKIDPGTYIERSTHGMVSTTNRNALHSQEQHETALARVNAEIEVRPAASSMNDMKFQELAKQEKGAFFIWKPVILDEESGNVITNNNDLAPSTSAPSNQIKTQEQMHTVDQMNLSHNSTTTSDTLEDVEQIELFKEQAMSSLSFQADVLDVKNISSLKPLPNSSENSKETIPDVILCEAVSASEESFRRQSSDELDDVSFLQNTQQLKPSANGSVDDSFSNQGTVIYPIELVDKKILVESSESNYLSDSKASILFPSKDSDTGTLLNEPSDLFKDQSELQVGGHPNLMLLHNNKDLEPIEKILSAENELLDDRSNSQAGPYIVTSDADLSQFDMPQPKETISKKLSGEGSIPFQCNSDLHENAMGPISLPASENLRTEELASSSSLPENTSEDTGERSQISQQPPMNWKLPNPPLGSLASSSSVCEPPNEVKFAKLLSIIENEPSQMLLTEGVQVSDSDCTIQSQKSPDILPIVEETCEPLFVAENKSSQDIIVLSSDETHPSTKLEVIPNVDENSQDLELQISDNGAANLDRKFPTPFLIASAKEDENYEYNQQLHSRFPPLPMSKATKSGNGSVPAEEMNSSLHDLTALTSENVNQPRKFHSVIDRPNTLLIEAIASHDKSKLNKVPELVRSSAMPKCDERGTFLEQIRNKSFSLKPTVAPAMKFKGGPPTNLKVIAILEKANAIRQACAGSDDEDEEDSWSDP
ncbi:SCAR-like protein 1 [Canna indica]|uniref:Protein SCAR n=1 Tax=Canna indica TaxID=4628 RepID=A0AAQ3L0L8_9LILI|nr:SCAR-like protein 1 [Canna indica]